MKNEQVHHVLARPAQYLLQQQYEVDPFVARTLLQRTCRLQTATEGNVYDIPSSLCTRDIFPNKYQSCFCWCFVTYESVVCGRLEVGLICIFPAFIVLFSSLLILSLIMKCYNNTRRSTRVVPERVHTITVISALGKKPLVQILCG